MTPILTELDESTGEWEVVDGDLDEIAALMAGVASGDGALRYSAQHAPEGGVTIQGQFYPGGQWIPKEVMDRATPAEKQSAAGSGAGVASPAGGVKSAAPASSMSDHIGAKWSLKGPADNPEAFLFGPDGKEHYRHGTTFFPALATATGDHWQEMFRDIQEDFPEYDKETRMEYADQLRKNVSESGEALSQKIWAGLKERWGEHATDEDFEKIDNAIGAVEDLLFDELPSLYDADEDDLEDLTGWLANELETKASDLNAAVSDAEWAMEQRYDEQQEAWETAAEEAAESVQEGDGDPEKLNKELAATGSPYRVYYDPDEDLWVKGHGEDIDDWPGKAETPVAFSRWREPLRYAIPNVADLIEKLKRGQIRDQETVSGLLAALDQRPELRREVSGADLNWLRAKQSQQYDADGGRSLAEMYASHWNLLLERGRRLTQDQLEAAAAELGGGGWLVGWDHDAGRWGAFPAEVERYARGEPDRYAAERAPKGGVTVAGKFYRGGQWIPGSQIAKADPATKEKIQQANAEHKAKRLARGKVDLEKLKSKTDPHSHHELSDVEMRSAKAALRGIQDHHGEATVHRLEELAGELHDALQETPEDEEGVREQYGKRLRAIGHMIDWAKEHPSYQEWGKQEREGRAGTEIHGVDMSKLPDGSKVEMVDVPAKEFEGHGMVAPRKQEAGKQLVVTVDPKKLTAEGKEHLASLGLQSWGGGGRYLGDVEERESQKEGEGGPAPETARAPGVSEEPTPEQPPGGEKPGKKEPWEMTRGEHAKEFKQRGMEVGYQITGNKDTFAKKDDLKKLGAEWVPDKKTWLLPAKPQSEHIARLTTGGSPEKVWIDWKTKTTEPHHSKIIMDALASGKPVPPEVLADYPDLAAQAGASQPQQQPPPSQPAEQPGAPKDPASGLTKLPSGMWQSEHAEGLFPTKKQALQAAKDALSGKTREEPSPATAAAPTATSAPIEQHKQSIRDAIPQLGGEMRRIHIADLHKMLPQHTPQEINAALQAMSDADELSLYKLDNPREIRPEDEAAAIRTASGQPRHIFYFGGQSSQEKTQLVPGVSEQQIPKETPSISKPETMRAEDWMKAVGGYTHNVDSKYRPEDVNVGDEIVVSSRGKPAYIARLGGKDRRYGRQREFLNSKREVSGMRRQIVSYKFEIDEPGEYEVAGDEFGKFKFTFVVPDISKEHRSAVESALATGKPVSPEVLADYPDLQAKYGGGEKTSPHPFEGKTREQVLDAMANVNDGRPLATMASGDPWKLRKQAADIPDAYASKVMQAAQEAQRSLPRGERLTVADVAAKLPGDGMMRVQAALAKLSDEGRMELKPFTRATYQMEHPEAAMLLDSEWMYYLEPSEKPAAQEQPQAPAEQPGGQVSPNRYERPPEPSRKVRTIERDANGYITRVVDEILREMA